MRIKKVRSIRAGKILSNYYQKFSADITSFGERIPASLLENCENVTLIYGASTIESIGDNAFANCWNLENFIGNIKYVGRRSFAFCKNLSHIYFPSIIKLSERAFEYSGIKDVYFGNNITIVPKNCFEACINLKLLNLNNIEEIEQEAFSATGIRVLNIPVSLEKIREKAFEGCAALSDIVCERFLPPSITSSTFAGCLISNIWFFSDEQMKYYLKDQHWAKYQHLFKITNTKNLNKRMEEIASYET